MKKTIITCFILTLLTSCFQQVRNDAENMIEKEPLEIRHYKSDYTPLKAANFVLHLVDTLSQPVKDELTLLYNNMVYVEGGTFLMGDSVTVIADELHTQPMFKETVGSFYICKYEVTQRLWELVMGKADANFKHPDRPMENITWTDGNQFMQKLKQLTGLPFRYPTEEEWEYAAKGGNYSKHFTYPGANEENFEDVIFERENITDNDREYMTNFVGQLQPNELGLYDMGGNVWEYCENDYRPAYNRLPDTGWKTIRGGSYRSDKRRCRPQSRLQWRADKAASQVGMRLAL